MSWSIYPVLELQAQLSTWQGLNASAGDSAMLHPDFIAPLIKHFGNGKEQLAIYQIDDQVKAMTVVEKTKPGVWQTVQPSQAPIGLWVSVPDIHLESCLQKLLHALPGTVVLFSLSQQDPDLLPRPQTTATMRTLDYIDTARIQVNTPFDKYWSARGKNLKHNLKRQGNRLKREEIEVELVAIIDIDDIRDAVKEYGDLESKGWKSEKGTSVQIDNDQGKFYNDMLQNFGTHEECRIYRYLYNKKLVATDLCVLHKGVLIILKTTFDESQKTSSPAMLMRKTIFNDIFEQKQANIIEFYGRVMDWHTKWSDEIRTMYHINCYRWALLAKLHGK
jgi:Acetyltransferase (GNAT) domain